MREKGKHIAERIPNWFSLQTVCIRIDDGCSTTKACILKPILFVHVKDFCLF